MNDLKQNGALRDSRSQEEINKDYQHVELFGFGKVEWKEKPESEWKNFPIRNQNGSGMCGAFAGAKVLGANNVTEYQFKNLDTRFIYNLRSNRTSEGMEMNDLFKILTKYGAPEDPSLESDNLTEEKGNVYQYTDALKTEALKYRGQSYIFSNRSIDEVHVALENGYYPIILLRCNIAEWTSEPKVISGMTGKDFNVSHFVAVVDSTMYKGKKCIIIEDSWGSSYGKNGRRIISEDFFDQRIYQVGYTVDWKPVVDAKPKYHFLQTLSKGMNNKDVIALQNILKAEGLFPNVTESTGYYGSITSTAVKALWKKYNIATVDEINRLQGNTVGPKTIAWLNVHYG